MVMTARTVGLVLHTNGMNARSAARPRNGARQLLTAEKKSTKEKGGADRRTTKGHADAMSAVDCPFPAHEGPLPLIPG